MVNSTSLKIFENNLKMKIGIKDDFVLVPINSKIYSFWYILSAIYDFIDENYILIDGCLEDIIVVQIKPKDKKTNLKKLGFEFNNILLKYAVNYMYKQKNSNLLDKFSKKQQLNTNN